jgi:hypothetical protein
MKNFTILAATVIVASLSGIIISQEIIKENGVYKTVIHKSYKVGQNGNLELRTGSGDIQINSWKEEDIDIKEYLIMDVYTEKEAEEIRENEEKGFKKTGNSVKFVSEKRWKRIKRNFEILVPAKCNLNIFTSAGDISVEKVSGHFKGLTSGGDIELENITGNVDAKTSGGDLEFTEINGKITALTSGGDVQLSGVYGETDIKTSGGDIEIFNAGANVTTSTSGGDIEVMNVKGDLTALTSGGDVEISHIQGNLIAKTSGGDIDIKDCFGDKNVVHTSGGDVNLLNIHGKLTANTSGGDISGKNFKSHIEVKTFGGDINLYDVQNKTAATTSGGDIHLAMTLEDFSIPHGLDLKTSGGDITIILPEKLPATINAEIHMDSFKHYSERYDIYCDFPLIKTIPDKNNGNILRSSGDINGGGDVIFLKTHHGDIYIKAK